MPGKVHLLPAPARVQWEVWDPGSYTWLVWVSSQELEHGGMTACGMANSPTPSVPARARGPRERMVAICKPASFALRDGGHGLVRRC